MMYGEETNLSNLPINRSNVKETYVPQSKNILMASSSP